MWSIASIQIASKYHEAVVNSSVFLVGFLHAATALDSFHSDQITLKHLMEGWQFFHAVVATHNLNDSELMQLGEEIERDLNPQEEEQTGQSSLQPIIEEESLYGPAVTYSRDLHPCPTPDDSLYLQPSEEESPYSHMVEIPELRSISTEVGLGSIWPQMRSDNIMPSVKRECILPILKQHCNMGPHHVEDDEVVADSIALHVLQVSGVG